MSNISDKICRENENTFYVQIFFPKFVLLIKVGKYGTGRHATENMQFSCQIIKARLQTRS